MEDTAPEQKFEKDLFIYILVNWCEYCEAYEAPYVKGRDCPGAPHDDSNRSKGIKRRMYICKIPDHFCEEMGFFKKSDLIEHQQDYYDSFVAWRAEVEDA